MTSSFHVSPARVLAAVLVAAVAGLFGAGCYNPQIADGGFLCSTMFTPDCPSGFHCENKVCVKGNGPSVDAAVEMTADTTPPVDAPVEQPTAEAGVDATACFTPVSGCTPDMTKTCDPVCQTGCGCHQKCSVGGGALACTAPLNNKQRHLGDSCDSATDGSDDCVPGLICLTDSCASRCYAFCRNDQDCPMSSCTHDAGGGQKACEVPFTTCDPMKSGTAAGCATMDQACYLSPTLVDKTSCQCPGGAGGMAGGVNTSCTIATDCFPGLACVDATGSGDFRCRQVCSLGAAASTCLGGTCRPLNGSTKNGFCN